MLCRILPLAPGTAKTGGDIKGALLSETNGEEAETRRSLFRRGLQVPSAPWPQKMSPRLGLPPTPHASDPFSAPFLLSKTFFPPWNGVVEQDFIFPFGSWCACVCVYVCVCVHVRVCMHAGVSYIVWEWVGGSLDFPLRVPSSYFLDARANFSVIVSPEFAASFCALHVCFASGALLWVAAPLSSTTKMRGPLSGSLWPRGRQTGDSAWCGLLGVGSPSPSLAPGGSRKGPEMVFELGLEGQNSNLPQTRRRHSWQKVQFGQKLEHKRPHGAWERKAGVGRNEGGVW